MPQSVGTGNTAPGLTTAAALLFVWAILTYAVRAWVKLRKSDSWGIDDTTISASLLLAFFHVATTCYAVNHGYGNYWSDLSSRDNMVVKKSLYASQMFYVSSIGLTKASISLFNTRLTREKKNVRTSYAMTALCALWTVASIFALAMRGDLSKPWEVVDGSSAMFVRWLGIEVTACMLEVILWLLSIYFIWSLHMPLSKRVSVAAIFACRLPLVPIVGLRLWYLSPSRNPNSNDPAITAGIYTQIALEVAFMLSNITCLKPFLRPFHSGYFVSTIDNKTSGYLATKDSGSRGDTYLMISTARSKAESRTGPTTVEEAEIKTADEQDDVARRAKAPAFRPDHASHRATVLSDHGVQLAAMDREGGDDMIISKTQAWTVSYEEDQQEKLPTK